MKKTVWTGVALAAFVAFTGSAMAADGAQKPQKKAQKRLEAHFKKLDTNHDDAISRDEWKGRPKAFDRLDADHNGSVSLKELERLAKARKHKG
jgi:Ca2+-binding EF-hand superfamily protein